jgi:hypothetical protein
LEQVGADYFVLTYISGNEGFGVDVEKRDPAKGLEPILSFGR